MWLSARVDYAVRAVLEIAARGSEPITAAQLAELQGISVSFLENILADLRRAGIITSRRGRHGGQLLARPAQEISVADVIRAETGYLADIHGQRPEDIEYVGAASHLTDVWVAARVAYRQVLESVSIADTLAGDFPPEVRQLLQHPEAWVSGRARLG